MSQPRGALGWIFAVPRRSMIAMRWWWSLLFALPAGAWAQAGPQADLVIESAAPRAPFPRGGVGVVEAVVSNEGDADAVGFELLAQIDGWTVARSALVTLAAGTSTTVTVTLALASDMPLGAYSGFVLADVESVIPERRETNNTSAFQAEVVEGGSDLVAYVFDAPAAGRSGAVMTVEIAIQNLGRSQTAATHAALQLISEAGAQRLVEEIAVISLASQGVHAMSRRVVLPAVPAGTYRWSLVADSRSEVVEGDESNNVAIGPPIVIGAEPPRVTSRALAPGWVGQPYSDQLRASITTGYWSVVDLPRGLRLTAETGVIQGTPREPFDGVLRVQVEQDGVADAAEIPLLIHPEGLALGTRALPVATVGQAYAFVLTAGGGVPPYVFARTRSLPAWLSVVPDGTLRGFPEQVGIFPVRVRVQDQAGGLVEAELALTVEAAPEPLVVEAAALPPGRVGEDYCESGARVVAFGGRAPLAWRIIGDRPRGLVILDGGRLCGVLQVAGTFGIEVGVEDAAGQMASAALTLAIAPAAEDGPPTPPSLGLETVEPEGCGCGVGAAPDPLDVVLVLALAVGRSRGRRRSVGAPGAAGAAGGAR